MMVLDMEAAADYLELLVVETQTADMAAEACWDLEENHRTELQAAM